MQGDHLRRLGDRLHLFGGASPRRWIELVGFVDQLSNARKIDRLDGAEHDGHAQATQKVVHAFRRSKQGFALGIGGILPGALLIIGREAYGFEVARVRETAHVVRRIFGKFRNRHHGKAFADTRPFHRVIVHKNEAVETYVQSRRNGLEVCGLVSPVRDECSDVRPLEEHLRMIAEYGFGDCRVVLGAYGENDPARLQLQGIALQSEVRFTGRAPLSKHDALEPVITDHTRPQSIVEVEDQAFLRQAALGGHDAGDQVAVQRRRLWRNFHLGVHPAPAIEPRFDPVALAGARNVQEQYTIRCRSL